METKNNQMQKSLKNGSITKAETPEIKKIVGGFINKIRLAQGLDLLKPIETEPYIAVWLEQFELHGVKPNQYSKLFNLALNKRVEAIKRGEIVPRFTIELVLAVHSELVSTEKPQWQTEIENCGLCNEKGLTEKSGKLMPCDHAQGE